MRYLQQVLIVPLWNWNSICNNLAEQAQRSNCTFMELKFHLEGNDYGSLQGSNRTFMELKYQYVTDDGEYT